MEIKRTEPATGGPNRTPRQEMAPLFDGPDAETEPEQYADVSPSLAWSWRTDPQMCTWLVLVPSMKLVTLPFAMMDSQAGAEAARGGELAGGVATYPFSDRYLPLSDQRDAEGNLIIDVNPDNFDTRWAHFLSMYPRYFKNGLPEYGGTQVMTAVDDGDEHYMGEFREKPRGERPTRARMLHTDGALQDADKFRRYLSMAQPVTVPEVSSVIQLGRRKDWDEAWVVAIYGEEGGGGHEAYEQYTEIATDHPWIHPVYFAGVMNPGEAAEDVAYLAVPLAA